MVYDHNNIGYVVTYAHYEVVCYIHSTRVYSCAYIIHGCIYLKIYAAADRCQGFGIIRHSTRLEPSQWLAQG